MNIIKPLTLLRVAAALLVGVAATGCFTGVESTPKITDADVRRAVAPLTADETYLEGIAPAVPLGLWREGRPFVVTDSRISLVLPPDDLGQRALSRGDTIRYRSTSGAKAVTGAEVADLHFTDSKGRGYTYRLERDPDSLQRRAVEVPFTVDLSRVELLRDKMQGQTYYILAAARRDSLGALHRGRKFIPVTIREVGVGTADYPVRLKIEDSYGSTDYLLLNPSLESAKTTGSFASLLSLSDPRLRYPLISDAVWTNIVNGRVAPGMTRDECRLALGTPADVVRQAGWDSLREAWRYENGTYLLFEDGILIRQ